MSCRTASFYAQSPSTAYDEAMIFAGETGRIATLPDIINARLSTEKDANVWTRWFTTNSAEYFGFTRGGTPIFIIAHGVGPLSTLRGIEIAYSFDSQGKTAWRKEGRISRQEFLELESGVFGDVEIIDAHAFYQMHENSFDEGLRSMSDSGNPLLRARLGPKADEFLEYQSNISLQWHRNQTQAVPKNWGHLDQVQYDRRVTDVQCHHMWECLLRDPVVVSLYEPKTFRYAKWEEQKERTYCSTEAGALAHLLTTHGLCYLNGQSLVTDIACHDWRYDCRFVAINDEEELTGDVDSFVPEHSSDGTFSHRQTMTA